jgi:isocitrate dehydrogenase (NAD+)
MGLTAMCSADSQDIMGTNKANPTALILSATMMLRHLNLDLQANAIAKATYDLVSEGKVRTADLGGQWRMRYRACRADGQEATARPMSPRPSLTACICVTIE